MSPRLDRRTDQLDRAELASQDMFTVEQRDALLEQVLVLGREDERVVAGAVVGSLAVEAGGDRFSDVDLTFGVAGDDQVADVLDDWTRSLIDELDAVPLVDLQRGPSTYRVFLLPDALQLDLSVTPASQFRPAGPRFRLVFGETAGDDRADPIRRSQETSSSPRRRSQRTSSGGA